MNVRLTVIGSSPAWPNPGSAHAGYLVESNGSRLLLDCGPGVLARLRTRELLPVDAIAITHFHLDHFGDLLPWVWFVQHGHGPDGATELWLPPEGAQTLAEFAARLGHDSIFERAFTVREFAPRRRFAAGGLEVEAIPVEHYNVPAFGFRVRGPEGALLAYSGDTSPCPGLAEIARGADLFLCEATLTSGADDGAPRGHLAADEALAVAGGRTLLTHRAAELPLPPGAQRASEGLVVELP
jgi:ribonuclease BN (tRNA processing enzyme)